MSRERENLVGHRAGFRVYIQEQLHALLPGFATQFSELWDSSLARWLMRQFPSAAALRAVGHEALKARLREAGLVPREKTLAKLLVWAADAPDTVPRAELRHAQLSTQLNLLEGVESAILAQERNLAQFLVQTPFVLFLSARGIGVVNAARYAVPGGAAPHASSATSSPRSSRTS